MVKRVLIARANALGMLVLVTEAALFTWLGFGSHFQVPKDSGFQLPLSSVSQPLVKRIEAVLTATELTLPEWRSPPVPAAGQWRYDLFTPPRVFLHPVTGAFEPTAYQFDAPLSIPPLELLAVRYPLFRYQLVGFVEPADDLQSKVILLIEDREQNLTHQIRFQVGAQLDDDYELSQLFIQRLTGPEGRISRRARLTLRGSDQSQVQLESGLLKRSNSPILALRFNGHSFELTESQPSQTISDYEVSWVPTPQGAVGGFECRVFHPESESGQRFILTPPTQS